MSSLRQGSARSTVSVIGAGYVGLATAVCLARLGHEVTCGDLDSSKVARLKRGQPTIVEDGLAEILLEGIDAKRLEFVDSALAAVKGAQFVFLCLPTPQDDDGSADMSALESVAKEIGQHLEREAIVINKSTVPVGSTLLMERWLGRGDVKVVSNPEFLREGTAIYDCLHPDRIVVGSDDQAAATRVGALFAGTRAPLIITDAATAETIKYASNAFLATKISFVNAIANFCERLGADARDVLLGMGYDHRIGFELMKPGPGWGGSCLPKDTRALLHMADQSSFDFPLLRGVVETNQAQLASVVGKIRKAAGGSLQGKRIAVWGLTFKAGTDDLRDSPAVEITTEMHAQGALVHAFDPTVSGPVPELPEAVLIASDPYEACAGADVLAVLTEWEQLRWLEFEKVRSLMGSSSIVDARNILDPAALRQLGFTYVGVGRP